MARKMVASKGTGAKTAKARAATGRNKAVADTSGSAMLRKQLSELRRENQKLHHQVARFEVVNFSLKNRVAALEEVLQDYGHIENPRLKRIIEEVQERTRGAGDLLNNGPF